MTNTDATTSYLQNCVDAKDDELYRVKGVRNELQDKCDALAAENAALRAALTECIKYGTPLAQSLAPEAAFAAFTQARAALEVTK